MSRPSPAAPSTLLGVTRQIFVLSVPLSLFQVGHTLLGVVDTAFVGRIGAEELAAVALGNMLLFTLLVFGMGIVFGTEPLIAQAVGASRHVRAWAVARVGIVLSLALTPFVVAGCFLVEELLPLFGVGPRVVELVGDYLVGRIPGVPFALAYTAVRGYLQAYGRTRSIVVAIIAANLLNVPMDYVLIFGGEVLVDFGLPPLGIPALGILGAGLASSVAAVVEVAITAWPARVLASEEAHGDEVVRDRDLVRPTLRLGVPVGLQYVAEVGVFAAVGVAMGRLGATELAGHQIALLLGSVAYRIVVGISSGVAVVVGHRVGAGDKRGTQLAGLGGLLLGAAVMSCSGSMFVLFPEALARAFTPDLAVVAMAVPLVQIAAAFALSDGLQGVMGGALRGAGEPAWAMGINYLAYWVVAFPLGLWLAFGAGLGGPGLWWGLTAGLTVAAVGQVVRFFVRARVGYAPS